MWLTVALFMACTCKRRHGACVRTRVYISVCVRTRCALVLVHLLLLVMLVVKQMKESTFEAIELIFIETSFHSFQAIKKKSIC